MAPGGDEAPTSRACDARRARGATRRRGGGARRAFVAMAVAVAVAAARVGASYDDDDDDDDDRRGATPLAVGGDAADGEVQPRRDKWYRFDVSGTSSDVVVELERESGIPLVHLKTDSPSTGGVAKNRGSVRGDREVERVVGFSVEQTHGGELRRVWIRG